MMDINNYSYTLHMLEEKKNLYAEHEDENGYADIALEQWGSDRNARQFVVTVCRYDGSIDFCENYPADCSKGWESMRHSFARAARAYNNLVPSSAAIPLF